MIWLVLIAVVTGSHPDMVAGSGATNAVVFAGLIASLVGVFVGGKVWVAFVKRGLLSSFRGDDLSRLFAAIDALPLPGTAAS